MSLGPVARGAICLLAASIVVLSTVGLNATSSAADISPDDDYGEGGGGDDSSSSSFSFTFRPETSSPGLVFGFYDETCPDAEEIISSTVRKLYHSDPNVAAALVRLFFHDCFIHVRHQNKQTPSHPASHHLPCDAAHTRTHQDAVFSCTSVRAGLRRLGATRPRRRPEIRARRRAEPVAPRHRRHRGDQAESGGGVP